MSRTILHLQSSSDVPTDGLNADGLIAEVEQWSKQSISLEQHFATLISSAQRGEALSGLATELRDYKQLYLELRLVCKAVVIDAKTNAIDQLRMLIDNMDGNVFETVISAFQYVLQQFPKDIKVEADGQDFPRLIEGLKKLSSKLKTKTKVKSDGDLVAAFEKREEARDKLAAAKETFDFSLPSFLRRLGYNTYRSRLSLYIILTPFHLLEWLLGLLTLPCYNDEDHRRTLDELSVARTEITECQGKLETANRAVDDALRKFRDEKESASVAKIHYASLQDLISELEELEPKYIVLSRIYDAVGGDINDIVNFLSDSSRMGDPEEIAKGRERLEAAIAFWSRVGDALVNMSTAVAD